VFVGYNYVPEPIELIIGYLDFNNNNNNNNNKKKKKKKKEKREKINK
jgi:hypothetical protein